MLEQQTTCCIDTLLRQTIDETFRVLFICLSVNIFITVILYKAINSDIKIVSSLFISRYSTYIATTLPRYSFTDSFTDRWHNTLYYLETHINQVIILEILLYI